MPFSVTAPSKVTTILTSFIIDLGGFFVVVNLYKWNHTLYTLVSWFPKVNIMFVRLFYVVVYSSGSSSLFIVFHNLSILSLWTFGLFPVWNH